MTSKSTLRDLLTPRQYEVASLIAQGKCDKEISEVLGIAAGTVNQHLSSIFGRAGIDNRVKLAVRFAIENHGA